MNVVVRILVRSALALAAACGAARVPVQAAHSTTDYPPLVVETGLGQLFTRNFNPFASIASQPTFRGEVYESLYIVDNVQFKEHPMLATSYRWSPDLTTITFTIRHGVRWSDGVPFTAQDVYYTLWTLPHTCGPTCDQIGVLGKTSVVTGVTMPTADQVALRFRHRDVTVFFSLMLGMNILPQHIWSKIKNPTTWTNPNPVGTGPFTQVQSFTPQAVDLGKNPYYWQPGKPAFDTLRQLAFTSTDAANLDLEAGQADWSGNSIPHVAQVYDARNPKYFHHFYYPGYTDNGLFFNDAKYPFGLVAFRKAMSMAMNRQALDINADFGYQPPANITALDPWRGWIDPAISDTLAQYNPAAARALLKSAGFTWNTAGQLIDPRGHAVAFQLIPTFYLAEGEILVQNFKALGIDASLRNLQFGDYFDRLQKGNFDAADEWGIGSGPSPYYAYEPVLDGRNYAPIGSVTAWAWERWKNPQMDKLLAAYRVTLDPARQHELADQMQQLFVQYLPVIPTVVQAVAENYNTMHYTGFPTASNNYAYASGLYVGDGELILLHLHPTQ